MSRNLELAAEYFRRAEALRTTVEELATETLCGPLLLSLRVAVATVNGVHLERRIEDPDGIRHWVRWPC